LAGHARRAGLIVIADGKRGDIEVTARAYAASLIRGIDTPLGRVEGLGADLVTVNPLMGRDAVEPFVSAARAAGGGVLVLVRTSRPPSPRAAPGASSVLRGASPTRTASAAAPLPTQPAPRPNTCARRRGS